MLLFSIFLSGALCERLDKVFRGGGSTRVVGGHEVLPKFKYPWMVSIQLEGAHSCGGTLYLPSKVVTAAHCVFDNIKKFSAKVHRHDLEKTDSSENGQTFKIQSRVPHPKFASVVSGYDVSVWTLEDTDIQGIRLPESRNRVVLDSGVLGKRKMDYLAIGWGRLSDGGPVSPRLMEVALPYVDPVACAEAYKKEDVIILDQSQICAGFIENSGQDTCQGDSGGPLFALDKETPYLVGIVSFGIGCANPLTPGVYTRISFVKDFILSQL